MHLWIVINEGNVGWISFQLLQPQYGVSLSQSNVHGNKMSGPDDRRDMQLFLQFQESVLFSSDWGLLIFTFDRWQLKFIG